MEHNRVHKDQNIIIIIIRSNIQFSPLPHYQRMAQKFASKSDRMKATEKT
jgi:hypothetical protein